MTPLQLITVSLLELQAQNFAKRLLSGAPYSVKWCHLKRGDLVMNVYWPCWFLCTISYKKTLQTDSGLKLLFTFQVWTRLFCGSMYFLFPIFSYLLYECVPRHTDDIKHFQQAEPEYFDHTNWQLKICSWRLYFSSWSPKGDLPIF